MNNKIELVTWGQENLPILVVDGLHPQPATLLEYAEQQASFSSDAGDFYPGQRAGAPIEYQRFLSNFFRQYCLPILQSTRAEENPKSLLKPPHCVYSVTTSNEADLLPIQCIPHFDQTNPNQWAGVHYLFEQNHGGTGFFRHKRSKFESVSQSRLKPYQRMLDDDAHIHGIPSRNYIQGSNELFEMIEHISAKFNRAIFYPANVLHTGLINPELIALGHLPRLTINSLFLLS